MPETTRKTRAQLIEEIEQLRAKLATLEYRPSRGDARLLESLTATEARYRSLLDHMPCVVAVYNAVDSGDDFVFVDFNEAGARIEGVDAESVIGKRVTEVFPGVTEMGLLEVFRRVWKTGTPEHHPTALYEDERRSGWRDNYVYRLPTGELVAVYSDVTEAQAARERLRRAEQEWQDIFQAIGHPTVILDAEHRLISANRATVKATGESEEELKGRRCWEVFHDPDACGPAEGCPFEAMKSSEQLTTTAMEMSALGGVYLVSCTPVFDEDGKLHRVIHIATDITDRKQAEDALRESEERLRAITESATDSIFQKDSERRYTFVNPAMERLLGRTADQFIGRTPEEIFDAGSAAVIREVDERALAGEQVSEIRTLALGGDSLTFHTVQVPLWDAGGAVTGIAGIVRDVTEQRRAEEALRASEERLLQSQKMEAIGTLAGGVAHDFNNLLTGILYFAGELKGLARPGEDAYESAAMIERAAERAAELTRQLLDFARKGKIEEKAVDTAELFHDVVGVLRRTTDKRISIEQQVCAEPATVLGDACQLQQVVLNLGVNACDAMPDGGELRFENRIVEPDDADTIDDASPPGRFVEIRVSDTGTGMPEEIRERIFEPFFTTKGEGRGTGMGLATVYGIVQNHGGTIAVESEIGRGTTFRVRLPFHAHEAAPRSGAAEAPVHGEGHVLVVDDEAIIRSLATRLLEQLGYRVTTVNDGEAAVAHYELRGAEIDLVILDLMMPKMSGRDCLARLRAIDPDVRVVLSSGYGPDASIRELVSRGEVGFVQKPYVVSQLSRVVAEALGRPAAPAS